METTIYSHLRHHAGELGGRILEMYPPLQRTNPVPQALGSLLRPPLPAQAIAIGGLAKHLRTSKAARIVAQCGAGKTYMALALAHVRAAGRPHTALVMCPSHITKQWPVKRSRRFPMRAPS